MVQSVNRQLSGDSYTAYNSPSKGSTCHDDNNLTLLVSERRCVKNEELFNGKYSMLKTSLRIMEWTK